MGGDGGSIPDRSDLVRTKGKQEVVDQKTLGTILYTLCAISKQPLNEPIVSCPLGRLYNKDAAFEALLSRSSDLSHIRSHKDLVTLILAPNPNYDPSIETSASAAGTTNEKTTARWICPITLRELNPKTKFYYSNPSGHVFAKEALDVMPLDPKQPKCPVSGQDLDLADPVRTINPKEKEAEQMASAWEERKRTEKLAKKGEKRRKRDTSSKSTKDSTPSEKTTSTETTNETKDNNIYNNDNDNNEKETSPPQAKKAKTSSTNSKKIINSNKPAVSSQTSKSIAAAIEKHRSGMSDTVASLYAPKQEKKLKATIGVDWMVAGTHSRT